MFEKPKTKDVVLVGGGHSHAIVLKKWGMQPMQDIRLTLISNVSLTPYSGMIPGYINGNYTYDELHIDLRRLAEYAGARFILSPFSGLDLERKEVLTEARPPIAFDALSLNIGSKPSKGGIPGAEAFATPIKPVPDFLNIWNEIVANAPYSKPLQLILVGGGVASIEVALSMKNRLGKSCRITLVSRDEPLLKTHHPKVRHMCQERCEALGIQLRLGESVSEVKQNQVCLASGDTLEGDHIFWLTHASAPSWLSETGLDLDDAGFIQVNNMLQSTSHDCVFAVGDIASMAGNPRPKSGVYAVRQAKPLFANLRAFCQDKSLIRYTPQKRALALIGIKPDAIASKGKLAIRGSRLWGLKDFIDRKFMKQFEHLSCMDNDMEPMDVDKEMRCLGCAAKMGAPILQPVLKRIHAKQKSSNEVLIGLDQPDDASVIRVPEGQVLVQSKDFFPALVNDPYLLGKIMVQHGFSDIFAMGAKPHSAHALALIPYAANRLMENDLYQCLSGMVDGLDSIGAVLLGGHTSEAAVLSMGITCNGLADPDRLLTKKGFNEGDVLILTKPLGIGTLLAAHMRLRARGVWLDKAIESMLQSNQQASNIFKKNHVSACTDITGFGLAGHLLEMLQETTLKATLELDTIPCLSGALETANIGILSTLDPANRSAEQQLAPNGKALDPGYQLLFDPQTSGGLLAGIPEKQAADCLATLKQAGYHQASIIGHITAVTASEKKILLV